MSEHLRPARCCVGKVLQQWHWVALSGTIVTWEQSRCCGCTSGTVIQQWHYLLIYLADQSTSFIHWAATWASPSDDHPSLMMMMLMSNTWVLVMIKVYFKCWLTIHLVSPEAGRSKVNKGKNEQGSHSSPNVQPTMSSRRISLTHVLFLQKNAFVLSSFNSWVPPTFFTQTQEAGWSWPREGVPREFVFRTRHIMFLGRNLVDNVIVCSFLCHQGAWGRNQITGYLIDQPFLPLFTCHTLAHLTRGTGCVIPRSFLDQIHLRHRTWVTALSILPQPSFHCHTMIHLAWVTALSEPHCQSFHYATILLSHCWYTCPGLDCESQLVT